MTAKSERERGNRSRGTPAGFRQEDVDRLRAGEMPEELIERILAGHPVQPEKRQKPRGEKLTPVDLSADEIEAAAQRGETSESLAERLEEAGKRDPNRKRAAGTRAARPERTPPGEKRRKR